MDDKLLLRFLKHQCSKAELELVEKWIATDKANAGLLFEMERIWSLKDEIYFSDEEKIRQAFKQFAKKNKLQTKRTTRQVLLSSVKYAAAIVIMVLLSLNLYNTVFRTHEVSMNTVEVPRGKHTFLTLSDGTKVWLNADTKFSYPSDFGTSREVYIEGEGYFDVTRNEKKPFVVNGNLFKISVLGTEFNVNAYNNENIDISLKKGRIDVLTDNSENGFFLIPNDQLHIGLDGETTVRQVDMTAIDKWTTGEIVITEQPLSATMKVLERKYDIPIIIMDEELSGEIFSCRAKSGASLEYVLGLLKETKKMNYKFDNGQLLITK